MILKKKSEFFINTVLGIASALFSILAIDLFARFVLDYRIPHDPPGIFKIDPITGWAKEPNWEGYTYLYLDGTKQYVKNNSHGFTDHERKLKKSKPRIALIGDSATEFWEVEEQKRGQFLMEQKLKGAWEVLNLGVRGFSTDQAYLLLKHIGMKFSPDIVIYTFCINDIYGNTMMTKPYFQFESEKKLKLILKDFPYPYKEFGQGDKKENTSLRKKVDKFLTENSFLYRKVARLFQSHDPMGIYKDFPLEDQIELRP